MSIVENKSFKEFQEVTVTLRDLASVGFDHMAIIIGKNFVEDFNPKEPKFGKLMKKLRSDIKEKVQTNSPLYEIAVAFDMSTPDFVEEICDFCSSSTIKDGLNRTRSSDKKVSTLFRCCWYMFESRAIYLSKPGRQE